jgi:hypothetical protein
VEIVQLKITDIKPYDKNAKIHNSDQIQHLMNSIKKYGFSVPVGVSGKDNVIVHGHGRWLAAKKLGLKEIPCVRLDHLSEEQQKAYRLADNSTAMMTGFDFDKLDAELRALLNFDKLSFGFGFSPKDSDDDFSYPSVEISPRTKDAGGGGSGGEGKKRNSKPAQYKCPGCGHCFNPAFENAVAEAKPRAGDNLDLALKGLEL